MLRLRRSLSALAVAGLLVAPNTLRAQAAAAATPAGPEVGQDAPGFTIPVVGKDGAVRPLTLSSLRGKTVVLAFFPRVRTQGCTVQMTAYRDKWAELFHNGENVTVIGISTDASADQQAWAREANFPMLFGSDVGGQVGAAYGAFMPANNIDNRYLYVIGPDGKIAYTAKPFRQMVETAYTDLGAAVTKARGGHGH
ncbi:MAG: redoxin domain-containing protein [Gemmatimonadaceae bacterium]|nr:redoxin domain-containing protein [Gemmatimonadaceae bacterium]